MKQLVLLSLLVFLSITLLLVGFSVFEEQRLVLRSRAYVQEVSGKNSFVIATPVCAKADQQEIERLYTYCLNSQGLPVEGVKVTLELADQYPFLEIKPVQAITDSTGKAIFDITSSQSGTYSAKVTCGDFTVKDAQQLCFQ